MGDCHVDQRELFSSCTDEPAKRIVKSNEILVNISDEEAISNISKPVDLGNERLGGIRLGFTLNPILGDI